MDSAVQTINNLTIGFTSQKGKQISILKNISTTIKKGETVGIAVSYTHLTLPTR